jgi:hypothetical protein
MAGIEPDEIAVTQRCLSRIRANLAVFAQAAGAQPSDEE